MKMVATANKILAATKIASGLDLMVDALFSETRQRGDFVLNEVDDILERAESQGAHNLGSQGLAN